MSSGNSHGPRRQAVRILSIDGGGVRGIIPARVLMELERLTGQTTASLFDIVAGTSTGGILALSTCRPFEGDGARHAVENVLDFYLRSGTSIFPSARLRRAAIEAGEPLPPAAPHVSQRVGAVLNPRRYGNARYRPEGLADALRVCVGDHRLADATCDVLVPAYDMLTGRPVVFSSRQAREGTGPNPPAHDVTMATTAAPTFFPAVHMAGAGYEYLCIDGGVVANNPVTIAYYEALQQEHREGRDLDVILVSLGTGTAPHDHPSHEEILSRSWLKMAMGMLGVVFDGSSDIADHLLREIITWQEPNSRYFRFQIELHGPTLDIDDASVANVNALLRLSDQLIATQHEQLRDLAALLTSPHLPAEPDVRDPMGARP